MRKYHRPTSREKSSCPLLRPLGQPPFPALKAKQALRQQARVRIRWIKLTFAQERLNADRLGRNAEGAPARVKVAGHRPAPAHALRELGRTDHDDQSRADADPARRLLGVSRRRGGSGFGGQHG